MSFSTGLRCMSPSSTGLLVGSNQVNLHYAIIRDVVESLEMVRGDSSAAAVADGGAAGMRSEGERNGGLVDVRRRHERQHLCGRKRGSGRLRRADIRRGLRCGGKIWTWPFGRHDGRNNDVQKLMHSSRWPGLLSCMVDILVRIANGDGGRKLEVLVWCKSGRCHSLAAAVWMAKVGRLVNLNCTVYLQRWNARNSQDKRCSCWNCAKPTGLHCFLLKDAHGLVDMMAKIAAGKEEREDVQADRARKRIRWMAGSMLRHLRHVEIHGAGRIYDDCGFDPYEEESLLGQHKTLGDGDSEEK